ncbi:uncharacterized protein LOC142582642 isoform X1 [Dermacentor variabilis]|uniref:uncharacterized protein LOC142582642 isoform X1 n=1 Tax=Dermacentor variabilis TaxID=34621 RepID=UPI003F5B23C5
MITSVTLLLLFIRCVIAYFNLEELRSFNYEVDIVSTPVKISDDIGASVILMMTKFGQEYQCSLPESSYPTEHTESDDAEDEAPNVLRLLEPLRNAPCLTKTRNWWTYELCYGKSIKQFHVENGKPEGAIIFLGLYDYDFDWNNETNLEQFNKTGQQKYHSQVYSHGSKCDITGVPRRAEVRYFCDEDSTDYIESVEEPETCSYVFTVHTSRVCAFPPLKRISPSKPHTISCSPRLTEKQYQKYLEVKENEKKLEEEKRKLWLLEQQKNLEAIKSFVKKEPSNAITNLEKPVVDIEEARPEVPAETQNDEAPILENTRNDVAKQFKEVFSKKGEGDLHDEATAQFKDDSHANVNAVLERLMKRLKQMEADAEDDAEGSAGIASQQHVAEGQQGSEHVGEPDSAAQDVTSGDEVVEDEYDGEDTGRLVSRDGRQDVGEEGDYEDNSGYPVEDGQVDSDASKQDEDGDHESQTGAEAEPEEVGSLRVRIRRYGRRKSKEPGKKAATYQELDLPSEDKSKLETALRDRLQKAGVTAGGRKIEVKIITAGYYDDEEAKGLNVLSPEETRQFQNMIVTLLMGNQEAVQEIEKHQRLEKNYNFVWNNEETNTETPASVAEDEEER